MTWILGLSAFYHDSAACLLRDGAVVAAAQEERFTRKKHDHNFPQNAARFCLEFAGISPGELDYVGFYDKPIVKFERLLETYVDYSPSGFSSFARAMPLWMKQKLWLPDVIRTELGFLAGAVTRKKAATAGRALKAKVLFGDHHESHASSAFYPSPFKEAAILTMDGVGEWATSSFGYGSGNEITLLKQLRFPDSLGLLYSAFTYYTGFKVNSGEYKVMGLAPYGEPRYVDLIRNELVEIRDDGSIHLNQAYFGYANGLRMTNTAFHRLFGGPPREPETELTQKELDLARSIQDVTEEVMLKMAQHVSAETGMKRLTMAGGVALNCVGNGRLLREGPFEEIWIQPAAGDAGGALGIALAIWHRYLGSPRVSAEESGEWAPGSSANGALPPYRDGMQGSYLGPEFGDAEIDSFIRRTGAVATKYRREELPSIIAELLASENVVGLHQGRMEFGPRALGNRSIIGDARSPKMQSVMNLKIKFRESFRPFAPTVQREHVADWFELDYESPYMLLVGDVQNQRRRKMTSEENALWGIDKLNIVRSQIPAVTHVDYSARVQTVRRETNPFYWTVIEEFRKRTGCPVIVNTSFNVRGEPIVCTPDDSYRCFMRTNMDALAMGSFLFLKRDQPKKAVDDRMSFDLD